MLLNDLAANKKFHIFFLACSSLLIFLGRANDIGLETDDSGYYAQKAKEVLQSGQFWIITAFNEPAFDNAPLPLWMEAFSFKLFSVSAYSAVLPSALLGLATVLLTYRLGEYLFNDRWMAFIAGAILIFPGFYIDQARRGQVDVHVTFFTALALFAFIKGTKNSRWYLLYGFSTALAILSKSILGIFPLLIGPLFLIFAKRYRELFNINFLIGIVLALGLGSTWYVMNWLDFGDRFLQIHFGWLIFQRSAMDTGNPVFFLGYIFDLLKNHWPWVPFVFAGTWIFFRKAFREGDRSCLFVLLWFGVILVVMSSSRSQTLRYILPVFPAMALMVARTLSDWLSEKRKEQVFLLVGGVVLLTSLLVNSTYMELGSARSLSRSSSDARLLAQAVNVNTPPGKKVMNYRMRSWKEANGGLMFWEARSQVYGFSFYADRKLSSAVFSSDELMRILQTEPGSTWLAYLGEFRKLESEFPSRFYLIQSTGNFAYFTSAANRKNIRYDFSRTRLPEHP